MGRAYFWAGNDDGSSWYRVTNPAMALQWSGHKVESSEHIVLGQAARCDVIVGSRVAKEQALELWRKLRALEPRPRLFVDLDDDYFHIEPSNKVAYNFWNAGLLAGLLDAIDMADIVIAASDGLGESLAAHGVPEKKIHVIPNGMHAMYLATPREYVHDGPVRIGWAGSANTAVDLPMVAKAMTRASETLGTVSLVLGVPASYARKAGLGGELFAKEWVTHGDPYLAAVGEFDIWVAPYHSSAFTEAKFPTKALEAGMLGIPLIASDIRPYREWITHGENGFLVREPHEWGKYIKRLVDEPALRRTMGEKARSRASQNIMQAVGRDWERVLFG